MGDAPEPIAVIGIGCRFPAAVNDLDSLWDLLIDGREAWSDVPSTRFNWESFYHPSRGANSAHGHRGGHFLNENIAAFDASFFGVSAAEAEVVDPQQRLLLEVAFEALENAGISLESARGSNTGVYIATFTHDYENMMYKDAISFPKYSMTGCGVSIVSNRISYVFDLKGPSFTLDTGCSGGLVAVHQACQSLRSGETNMALAGGTNLILSPDTMIPMDLLHLLNANGQCYSFDQRGAGYGRGEGVAVVALKRLRDAVKAGDVIHAVIRGSGIGQDGKTAGITLPSARAQQNLIESTYRAAQLDPLDTDYIEAHGTGTAKGDLAELQALVKVFCDGRKEENILYVDSIKANIGHLESASGLAGLIKSILVLKKGIIPPNLKLKSLKEELAPFTSKLKIPREPIHWHRDHLRRASINSFGYGGTNSHVIIEHPQCIPNLLSAGVRSHHPLPIELSDVPWSHVEKQQRFQIVTLSAKSPSSLLAFLPKLTVWAERQNTISIRDLAYTLNQRRSLMLNRHAFVVAADAYSLDSLRPGTVKVSKVAPKRSTIFLFSGQGAQWYGMARELLDRSQVFRKSMVKSDGILQQLGASWSLLREMMQDEQSSRINDSQFAQPITTAVQIGIVDLLHSLSVQPDHVVGHSSGEIAAAYAAGALDQEAALTVAYHRGTLASLAAEALQAKGAMMAVGLSEEDVEIYLRKVRSGLVSVACSNSPTSTTISGDVSAIEELDDLLKRFAISATRLKVDTAYHSQHMKTVATEYRCRMKDVQASSVDDTVQFYSTVTAHLKTSDFGPDYWVSNLTSKVRFRDAVENLCKSLAATDGGTAFHAFIEIGAHTTLSLPIKQTVSHMDMRNFQFGYLPILTRDRDSELTLLKSISTLFEWGWTVNIAQANRIDGSETAANVISNLPHYAWDHSKEFWWESRLSKEHRFRKHPYHDLLGVRTPGDHLFEPTWRHLVSVDNLPWIRDHGVQGRLIFPGAGYLAMAIEAKRQITTDRHGPTPIRGLVLSDVVFAKLLELPDNSDTVELQISLRAPLRSSDRTAAAEDEFRISSISASGVMSEHCHGRIEVVLGDPDSECTRQANGVAHQNTASATLSTKLEPSILYTDLKDMGHLWGPTFALIDQIKIGDYDAEGTVRIPDIAAHMPGHVHQPHVIHPTTLDALIHSTLMIYARACARTVMFPVGIEQLRISADITTSPGDELRFESTLAPYSGSSVSSSASFDISVYMSSPPHLCLQLKNGQLRGAVEGSSSDIQQVSEDLCYTLEYGPDIDLSDWTSDGALEPSSSEEEKLAGDRIRVLDQAALYYSRECLKQVPLSRIAPRHERYAQWIGKLQEQRVVNGDVSHIFKTDVDEGIFQSLGAEKEAVSRLGIALPNILTGDVDPLSLLLEGDLLQRVYAEDVSAVRCAADLSRYMQQFTFKYPNLRVLEIGAGTGGATLPLLEALGQTNRPLIDQYDFTDVSSGFFEAARTKLSAWKNILQFKTLDIGVDPVSQGFTEHSYDVVIGYNALHVTNFIDSAISNARKLLRPGGKLILIEITQLALYMNAIFGLLPGWYLDRSDGRVGSPILSVEQWSQRLKQNYFDGIDYHKKDYEGTGHQMSLIVATASVPIYNPPQSIATLLCLDSANYDVPIKTVYGRDGMKMELHRLTLDFDSLEEHKIEDGAIYVIIDGLEQSIRLEKFLASLVASHVNVLLVRPQNGVASKMFAQGKFSGSVVSIYTDKAAVQDCDDAFELMLQVLYQSFLAPQVARSKEKNYLLIGGKLTIPRLVPYTKLPQIIPDDDLGKTTTGLSNGHNHIGETNSGQIKPLKTNGVIGSTIAEKLLGAGEVEIQVYTYGLGSEELLQQQTAHQMIEFAGVVVASGNGANLRVGDRVYGWTRDVVRSQVRLPSSDLCELPSSVSFAAACSMIGLYSLAHHALVVLGCLQRDQSVLIHNANQALGHALIEICQLIGAQVIATVSTEEKLRELRSSYPRAFIILRGSMQFSNQVLRQTNNQGVDIVVDTLGDGNLLENINSVAAFGKYIGIPTSNDSHGSLPLWRFGERNLTFAAIDWKGLLQRRFSKALQLFKIIIGLLDEGKINHSLGQRSFSTEDVKEAIKTTQTAGRTRRIVLGCDGEPDRIASKEQPIETMRSDGTYIIVGDLEGLGLDLCRYATSRGARHLVFFNTARLEYQHEETFRSYFSKIGTNALIYTCDETGWAAAREQVRSTMPTVRGILVADATSNWKNIESYLRDLCELPFRLRGLVGITVVVESCEDLDFALVVYTSGKSYGATFSNSMLPQVEQATGFSFNKVPGAVIIVSSIKDFTLAHQDLRSIQDLARRGFKPVPKSQLYRLIDQTLGEISTGARNTWRTVVAGVNRRSISDSDSHEALNISIFSQLPALDERQQTETNENKQAPVEKNLKDAKSIPEAQSIVISALQRKISSLVAVEHVMLDRETPIEDFGLDSLIMWSLQSWILQNFRATLKPSEISDAANVGAVATLILSRSSLRPRSEETTPGPILTDTVLRKQATPEVKRLGMPPSESDGLPHQPLPELAPTFEALLDAIEPICTKEELENTTRAIAAFQAPDSVGLKLHERLVQRFKSPGINNWLTELYTTNRFLRQRSGLVPFQTYFGSHPHGKYQHSQAERAAVLSLAAIRFKQRQESGQLEPQYLSGQIIDPDSSLYLFNSCRIPGTTLDILTKNPSNNYIVVLRRGHIFKVNLYDQAGPISLTALESIFHDIITSATVETSFLGSLSANLRTPWSQVRSQVASLSTENQNTIHMIEAAAFIVCLDTSSPDTPEQRFRQFLSLADTNRWYDKTLQFVVCENGASASVIEHAALDGVAVEPLHEALNKAIREHDAKSNRQERESLGDIAYKTLSISISEQLSNSISDFREHFRAAATKYSFAVLDDTSLGRAFIESHKWPLHSTIQLAIQLASRRFFGYSPFSMETVCMAHYRGGRVEVNPIIRQAMRRFLDTAVSLAPLPNEGPAKDEVRSLAYAAAREHAKFLTRASNGRAFGRHLQAMEWVREEDELVPDLFTDTGYLKSKAAKVLTSSFSTGWLEGGFVYPVPGGVLVYFEIKEHSISYSIFGNAVEASAFHAHLAQASKDVRTFFGDGASGHIDVE